MSLYLTSLLVGGHNSRSLFPMARQYSRDSNKTIKDKKYAQVEHKS